MGIGPVCGKCGNEILENSFVDFSDEGIIHLDCEHPMDLPEGVEVEFAPVTIEDTPLPPILEALKTISITTPPPADLGE